MFPSLRTADVVKLLIDELRHEDGILFGCSLQLFP